MTKSDSSGESMSIFVTDFDGTLAQQDFYSEVLGRLMPRDVRNFYADYLRGEMTHFECLASYFGSLRCTERELLDLVDTITVEPDLPQLLIDLLSAGWEVVVASAGCAWYIERVLANARVQLTVHASPGRWRGDGLGLEMLPPTTSPYFAPELGIDKRAVVRAALATGQRVAFAGDGHTDVGAAKLVEESLRFAKDDCADDLRRERLPFHEFTRWRLVAEKLIAIGG
jgi:2-hydroxy-3-keto-5-methylthiopentenyl-1-phosphate phosphatase